MKISVSDIKFSSKVLDNTWQNYNPVNPSIIKKDTVIIKTEEQEVFISNFEEVVLYIIANFLFAPVWLVENWIKKYKMSLNTPKNTITSWVNTGLVWIEPSVTGLYLRPTNSLFKLFNMPIIKYRSIPYNQLSHTICEEQVTLEIMLGDKDNNINKVFSKIYLPRYSPLDLKNTSGTNIINEFQFNGLLYYKTKSNKEISDIERSLEEQINDKKAITDEFTNFSKFVIVKKDTEKNNYLFHVPDLIIPIKRKDGRAQSIAIEVELSDKKIRRYTKTLEMYKNNNRYGYVVWLSQNDKITSNLTSAFKKINGLGDVKMAIYPFKTPMTKSIL